MGLAIKEIIAGKEITLEHLQHKVVAIDSFNMLYQFLSTIRARDGTLLQDAQGDITSHLVGLFSRTLHFMEKGIKPIFVFDGEPPALKKEVREKRKQLKEEADKRYKIAVAEEDIEAMRKYAARTVTLTPAIIQESKRLIEALGLPIVQAPSEGEAQAAFLVQQGDAFACVSQDFDSLLHGATRLVRNLSIAGRKKKTNRLGYEIVKPQLIELRDVLQQLGIDADQFVVLAILVGTDYNQGGIKGIGPKNALRLVKSCGKEYDKLFKEVQWDTYFAYPWQEVFEVIKNMPVTKRYDLSWKAVDEAGVKNILCSEHDFSEERVHASLSKLREHREEHTQKSLVDF